MTNRERIFIAVCTSGAGLTCFIVTPIRQPVGVLWEQVVLFSVLGLFAAVGYLNDSINTK